MPAEDKEGGKEMGREWGGKYEGGLSSVVCPWGDFGV